MVEAACLDWLERPEVEREALAQRLAEALLFAHSLDAGGNRPGALFSRRRGV